MNGNTTINIGGKEYYESLLPVENYNRSFIQDLQLEIDQNKKIIPIREPQTQTTSNTELSNRSMQPTRPQKQHISEHGDIEEVIRLKKGMESSNKKSRIMHAKTIANYIIPNGFGAKTIANALVKKINAAVKESGKSTVRSTISHIMIELAKLEKNELAADIISEMVKQGYIGDAIRILIHVEHNTNSKDAKDVSDETNSILSNMQDDIIKQMQCHIPNMKFNFKHVGVKNRVHSALELVIKERERAFIVATAHDMIEMLKNGKTNYEDIVDYLLMAAGNGDITAASEEILNAMTYGEPTNNQAVLILRAMEDILMNEENLILQWPDGTKVGLVTMILQKIAEKLPNEGLVA